MQRSSIPPAPIAAGLLLLGLLLAACGGGGTAATDSSGAGSAATDALASTDAPDAPAPTDAPGATDAPAATDAGTGSGSGDVCGLVTVAEMESLFGVSGVTQGFFAGPPDTCDYQLDSAPFVAMVLTPFSASPIFDAMSADAASESIGGIGDRALYNRQMLTFLVQKGESLLTLQILDESRSEDERLELMKQVAAIAAGRM